MFTATVATYFVAQDRGEEISVSARLDAVQRKRDLLLERQQPEAESGGYAEPLAEG